MFNFYLKQIVRLIPVYVLFSCSVQFSPEKAKSLIEAELQLPKLIEREYLIRGDSKAGRNILKFIKEGYFLEGGYCSIFSASYEYCFAASQKGKPYLTKVEIACEYENRHYSISTKVPVEEIENGSIMNNNSVWFGNFDLEGSIYYEVPGELGELLIDEDTKTAITTFTTKVEPVEPFFTLICDEGNYMANRTGIGVNNEKEKITVALIDKTNVYSISFKEYDKGWRITHISKEKEWKQFKADWTNKW